MNKKTDLVYGLLLGLLTSIVGCYAFILFFTDYTFILGYQIIKAQGNLGKLITLGAVLNLIVFFGLLQFNKDMIARGVILAMIILTIITLFT